MTRFRELLQLGEVVGRVSVDDDGAASFTGDAHLLFRRIRIDRGNDAAAGILLAEGWGGAQGQLVLGDLVER